MQQGQRVAGAHIGCERRHAGHVEVNGVVAIRLSGTGVLFERSCQFLRAQVQLPGRQNRPVDIVAAGFIALFHVGPEVLHGALAVG